MCSGSEAGSYLRLIDSCTTQLKAQRPCKTCNESTEEDEGIFQSGPQPFRGGGANPERVRNLKHQVVVPHYSEEGTT